MEGERMTKTHTLATARSVVTAALALLLAPGAAFAQAHANGNTNATTNATTNAYAGEQTRAIKSLADSDIAGLLAGQGAGLAKAAELNGYPGPAHTLELRERLGLSAEQIAASEALMAEHKRRARELGASLVDAERPLDALFAHRRADPAHVDEATRAVGLLQARLRAEHLNTHVAQTALLNAEQVRAYDRLRGYAPAGSDATPHHGRH
jgi:hypothetical protein